MLPRVLEREVMDSADDASHYDSMDHLAVNVQFVADLLEALADRHRDDLRVLDLGAGTAQIPIELARRASAVRITAVDAAESMLMLARENVAAAGFRDRVELVLADAKKLPFEDGSFPLVISNSIVHHIPDPREVFAEALRVTAAGGLLFHRDLARPSDHKQLNTLVDTYTANDTAFQRRLFAESLHASLSLEEVQQLVAEFDFAPETVRMTSDRHWTWISRKL
jgi:ubiquinone/menaquinone biosynthesis C-methylase UbiE